VVIAMAAGAGPLAAQGPRGWLPGAGYGSGSEPVVAPPPVDVSPRFVAPPPALGGAGVAVQADPGPEPTVWGGVSWFARALASDGWAALRAPLHVDGRDAWVAGGVLAVGAVLYGVDGPLMDEVRRSREDPFWSGVEDVGETLDPLALMGNTNPYWAAGAVAGYVVDGVTGHEGMRHLFEELLISHWIAGALRKGIGRPIGRRRPYEGLGPYHYSFMDGSSFPSGHASTITQLAAVLSHHVGWWPASVLLYAGAAAVVYQRVSTESHWPSDAYLGAAWGLAVARVVIARRDADRIDFLPFF
jgi:hypothetical protein